MILAQAPNENTKRQGLWKLKLEMQRKGWSNRSAALALGCTLVHLNYVLNGHRVSKNLVERVKSLPKLTGIAAKGKAVVS